MYAPFTRCQPHLYADPLQLIGGCPIVASFSSNRHSRDIRLEAALFIGSVCRTSLLTVSGSLLAEKARRLTPSPAADVH